MVEDEVKMRAKTRKPLLPLSQAARGLGESCWGPGTRSRVAALPSGISVAEGKDTDCRFLARQNCTTSAARCRE